MPNKDQSPFQFNKMRKAFDDFETAVSDQNLLVFKKESIKKAKVKIQEILDDPFAPAEIKLALIIALKAIEKELDLIHG